MQFQFNSDYPDESKVAEPLAFPPADPVACARITTRIYHPTQDQVSMVQNVLVRTPRRPQNPSNDSSSSSSDDDDDDMLSSDSSMDSRRMMDSEPQQAGSSTEDRAYWMQRTIRDAIYGRVLFAIVLRKRPAALGGAEWEVTSDYCAVKEMSWQHIRRERDRLAEDPIKEVSAMQYIKKWHTASKRRQSQGDSAGSDNGNTDTLSVEESFQAIMETNIMMPLDLLSDDRNLYSIMPFCDGGELFDRLDLNERFSEEEARYWMHQVLNGLENLQHSGICHRDMSLENMLVHKSGALVIDMGMCLRVPFEENLVPQQEPMPQSLGQIDVTSAERRSGRTTPRYLMTPQGTCGKWVYMSPEIYQNRINFDGFAVDLWAAGVILFLMLTGFPPWERACMTDERFKYMSAGYLVQMLTEWELGISSDAMDLLQRMLFLDPHDRLSLDQVRAHPWMTQGNAKEAPRGIAGMSSM